MPKKISILEQMVAPYRNGTPREHHLAFSLGIPILKVFHSDHDFQHENYHTSCELLNFMHSLFSNLKISSVETIMALIAERNGQLFRIASPNPFLVQDWIKMIENNVFVGIVNLDITVHVFDQSIRKF
jgi:hypothetical protein